MAQFKTIGLTVKSGLQDKNKSISKILSLLEKEDVEILLDKERFEDLPCSQNYSCFQKFEDLDLLIVVGGDGTILRTIREMNVYDIPLLSINRGTVGFLAEIQMEEVDELLPSLLNDEGILDERSMLDIQAFRGTEIIFEGRALNEAVIAQGTIARLVYLKTTVNEEPLTLYHADGLILSTPTGSTAYSLAAGGPIVHPGQTSTIITPINPHSFSQKPIVIRGESVIEVEVRTKPNKFADAEVILTLDGQIYVSLAKGDRVRATMSQTKAKFLRRKQDTFYATLRKKLKWGETLED